MTRRRYIFFNKEDRKLYITPEFNGDSEEFALFKARMDSCDITWSEIAEKFKMVNSLEEFKKANEQIQNKYHSFLETEFPKEIEDVIQIENPGQYSEYYKQSDQIVFVGNNSLYAVDIDGSYEEDTLKSIYEDNKIDIQEMIDNMLQVGITIDKVIRNICMNPEMVFIEINNSNIKLLRFHDEIAEKYNCINIYSGSNGNIKNGYWFDKNLDYKDFANELLQYHSIDKEEEEEM